MNLVSRLVDLLKRLPPIKAKTAVIGSAATKRRVEVLLVDWLSLIPFSRKRRCASVRWQFELIARLAVATLLMLRVSWKVAWVQAAFALPGSFTLQC